MTKPKLNTGAIKRLRTTGFLHCKTCDRVLSFSEFDDEEDAPRPLHRCQGEIRSFDVFLDEDPHPAPPPRIF